MPEHSIHTEATFEAAIVEHLCNNGWLHGNAYDFNKEFALDIMMILQFVQQSQNKEWEKLKQHYRDDTENKFIQRLFKELDLRGTLEVIRHGISDSGCKFQLAYFKPDSNLNPDTIDLYKKNLFSVTRQVYFSEKNKKSNSPCLSVCILSFRK